MLTKDPESRINLSKIREHSWVTKNGEEPLPPTEENVVGFITVTAEEVRVKYSDDQVQRNLFHGRCNLNIFMGSPRRS